MLFFVGFYNKSYIFAENKSFNMKIWHIQNFETNESGYFKKLSDLCKSNGLNEQSVRNKIQKNKKSDWVLFGFVKITQITVK